MRSVRLDGEFEKDARQMVLHGLSYAAIGLLLVVLSYQANGWPRWPLAIAGWLFLVAGTWTILFRLFINWLVVLARRSPSGRTRQ